MGHALLLLPRANSSPPLRNKTRMRRRCPETRSLQTPLRASPRYLIHRGRASPEPLGNWSRTRSTSGDGKQLRRLAAVRRLSGVRDTSCLTQGALCPLTVYPLSVSYRSTTERHVAIDLVAIAIRGDGRCHLGPVIPGVRFGGRRSHASTPGLIGVDGCGNECPSPGLDEFGALVDRLAVLGGHLPQRCWDEPSDQAWSKSAASGRGGGGQLDPVPEDCRDVVGIVQRVLPHDAGNQFLQVVVEGFCSSDGRHERTKRTRLNDYFMLLRRESERRGSGRREYQRCHHNGRRSPDDDHPRTDAPLLHRPAANEPRLGRTRADVRHPDVATGGTVRKVTLTNSGH